MMNNEIRISIAMATYNGERYLREQLDSLYTQTRVPDEVVVCDDRSNDATRAILEEYNKRYGLRYYINEVNLGVNKNFERAIRLCTGDYIAICDQDDVWMPQKIEVSLKKIIEIEEGKPACVSSQNLGVDKNLVVINKKHKIYQDSQGYKATLLQDGVSQGCSLMINKELIGNLKSFPQKGFLYDAYIGLAAACIGNKYNLAEPLMYYRHHESNVVGKEIDHQPILPRIVNHLRMWKYSTLFEYTTFEYIRIIREQYGELIDKEILAFIDKLQLYEQSGLINKIGFILKENYFHSNTKIKKIIYLLLTSCLPVKNNIKIKVEL